MEAKAIEIGGCDTQRKEEKPLSSGRGLCNARIYEFLEAERIKYAIRLPANQVLQGRIGYLLKRPVGRPTSHPDRQAAAKGHTS